MNRIIYGFLGSCLLLAGCAQGEAPDRTMEPMAVQLQVTQDNGVAVSRATSPLAAGTMGVYRTAANGYEALTNVRYTYNTTTTVWDSDDVTDKTKTVYVDHRDATLYAYYPYSASAPAGGVFTLGLKRYETADDLLCSGAKTGVNNRVLPLAINMKHAYARLTVRLRNSSPLPVVLSGITLTPGSGSFVTDGSIDISAATPAATAGSATVPSYAFPFAVDDAVTTEGVASGTVNETVDMLWIPQTFAGDLNIDMQFIFTGLNIPIKATVTVPRASLPELKQGSHYVLPLLIRQTGILEFTVVEMKDWTTATVADTEVKEN